MVARSSRAVLAELSGEVPAGLDEHARAWREHPVVTAPVFAASVLLLRDRPGGGVDTYLLHRHARMPFAPNMVVFPGGRVDPVDGVADGSQAELAACLRSCAVRETAEETGVVLAAGALVSWAHWITPEFEPRRYDTWFYLAALPVGQRADDISGETDRAGWRGPADALRAADRGELALMPPTRSLLLEVSRGSSVAELLSGGRDRVVEAVLPRLEHDGEGWRFRYPRPGEAGA